MAINIKWNNHQSTFFKILKTQSEKSKYTDATLAVDGKFYTVHKNIMSTSSEYFSDIFEKTSCKSPVIVLKDVPSNDMEALLDYIYLGEVDVKQNSLASFLDTAKYLKIKGLGVPDEYQTKLPKNSSSSCEDAHQNSCPPKRRRNDSSTIATKVTSPVPLPQNTDTDVTIRIPKSRRNGSSSIPTKVASPVPLTQNIDTDVTICKLISSAPTKNFPNLPNTENSATASVNSAQTPSIPSYSNADASITNQDEPTEVKDELDDANKDCEFEEFTKTEHEVDIYENTSFSRPSASDIKEDEPLASPSMKPREDPSMCGSTRKMNIGIKVKEFSLLQESTLLKRSGHNLNNIRAEEFSGEKNKENCTRAVRKKENEISQEKTIQSKCMLHKCSHCYKTFLNKNELLQHMKIHTGRAKNEYKCIQCHRIFSTSKALKTHIIGHARNKPYYCGDCDLEFSQKEDLLNHTKNHAGEKQYQCNKCKESFSRNAILKVHMKTHIEEMPHIEGMIDAVKVQHQCTKCDKSFLHASILKTHINTHAQEKPYNISDGNMVLKKKEEILHHIKSNSDKRPYKCNKCNKAFSQNHHLKYHMVTHTEKMKTLHKPYKCKYCEKTFSQKSYVSVHIMKHTNFKCLLCDKTFSLNSALRCHMKSAHIEDMRIHSLKL